MRRPLGFFLLAGFAAMLAALVVYGTLKQREAELQRAMAQNVEVVVAAQDLPLGSKIDPSSVKLVRWSRDSLPPGSYQSTAPVLGSFVKSAFVVNEPIVSSKLFTGDKAAGVMPLLIPAGMRAMSVPVDEVSDIAGFVAPHSRVDVLVAVSTQGADAQKPFSKAVLQNVEVLAVAQEIEGTKDPHVVKVVTLLVTLDDAERLALASHEGSLRLVMRNYNDQKIVLTRGVDMGDMLHAFSSRERSTPTITSQAQLHQAPRIRIPMDKVDILRNGKSSESLSFINLSMNLRGSNTTAAPASRKHLKLSRTRKGSAPAASGYRSPVATAHPGAKIESSLAAAGSAEIAAPAHREDTGESNSGLLPHSRTIDLP